MDDPHFLTWAPDTWYDFMGACDLHLLISPSFAPGLALTIDIRTKIRTDYSYIESAVVQIGNETLEVGSFGDYYLNGVDGARMPKKLSGYVVDHKLLSKKSHLFDILISGHESIKLKTFKDMVSVKIENASTSRFHDSLGMMGEFTTGKLLARNGLDIIEDPNALAAEWQVRSDEPMLFQTALGPQHPQACEMPAKPAATSRRLGESLAINAATAACAHLNGKQKDGCVHDVLATGDLDLAASAGGW